LTQAQLSMNMSNKYNRIFRRLCLGLLFLEIVRMEVLPAEGRRS
jgi:hypothetical protein